MTSSEKKLLTIEEASHFLSIKISRLRTAVFKKEIPFVKIGRLVRFQESDLLKWIESNTHGVKKESRGVLDAIFND